MGAFGGRDMTPVSRMGGAGMGNLGMDRMGSSFDRMGMSGMDMNAASEGGGQSHIAGGGDVRQRLRVQGRLPDLCAESVVRSHLAEAEGEVQSL
ncbi:unnamed protein product, partial [Lampetra planeri]